MKEIFENPLNRHVEKIVLDENLPGKMLVKLKSLLSYNLLLQRLDFYSTTAGLEGSQEKEFEQNGRPEELTVVFKGNIEQAVQFLQLDRFITPNILSIILMVRKALEQLGRGNAISAHAEPVMSSGIAMFTR